MSEGLLIIFFIVFCTAAAVQLVYYLWFYLAPALPVTGTGSNEKPPVSVIICARNEASNLRNFLPSVLEQDYPSFEVIIVNDCSEDDTYDVLGTFLTRYQNLKITSITKDPKFTHNKKLAQFIGIKAAANEILVFTDADCKPESDKWLSSLVSSYSGSTDIVLGYGGFFRKKGILNSYIRYDSMFIAMQYFGMAIRGLPYMGVGRNMSYRKSLFFRNKGFGAHNHLQSGDDDLFVNTHARGSNTTVQFRKESHTRSIPASKASEWVKQKQRHFTTARYYRFRDKVLLLAEPLYRVLFYSLFILLVSLLYLWPYLLAVFGLRFAIQITVTELVRRKLNEPRILLISLIFDILSPLINLILYLTGVKQRQGKITWK